MASGWTTADAPTFEEVVDTFEVPLVRYAFRLTRDVSTARDVVQDTFMRLLRHGIPEPTDQLPSWLCRVCRNRAIDVGRGSASDTFLDDDAWASPRDDAVAAPVEGFDPRLSRAVAALPPTQQEVVWLPFAEGLSCAEIGAVLGKSPENVGVVLRGAISTLRAAMFGAADGADSDRGDVR